MTQTPMLKIEKQDNFTFIDMNRDRIQKILGNVAYDKAFYFYEDIDKPTEDHATSLSDFCNKINTVSSKSLTFHFKRGDFENWIQEAIGDTELSQLLSKLRAQKTTWKNDKILRKKLQATIRERVAELQDGWHQSLKWLEAWSNKP